MSMHFHKIANSHAAKALSRNRFNCHSSESPALPPHLRGGTPMSASTDRRTLGRRGFVVGTAAGAAGAALAGPLAGTARAAAFGYTDDGTHYVIDTGANLVFKVRKSNGDLSSLVYRGTEYQGYGGMNSHIESGLGSSTVT